MAGSRPGKNAGIRAVYDHAQSLLLSGDSDGWCDMFVENGIMDIPQAPPGMKNHFEGRETIRKFLKPVQQKAFSGFITTPSDDRFHEAGEVLVHEYISNKKNRTTGEVFSVPYVHIVTIRNGEYVLFRDYALMHAMPPVSMPTVWENLRSET